MSKTATMSALKFANDFSNLVEYLTTSFPNHEGFRKLQQTFTNLSQLQPGKFRQMFDEYIYSTYADRIYDCDVTVMDDIRADGHDLLELHEIWNSKQFTEYHKATCFHYLTQCCDSVKKIRSSV